eukprot:TRINITY_DN4195_c0_g2_i1.p1 TRINITY_DN4195_c0_g2~~TRINITY_DN4195_c0_g2_i1.p1  ORF type:complete len:459 (+),score=175.42 TRINITY_DN4195_c0_g2_i1:73-1449(+)
MKALSSFDLYRRIPKDLTAATTQGGLISCGCMTLMMILFMMEVWHYCSPPLVTQVVMDSNTQPRIQINFNITAHEMPCDWLELDMKDRLGLWKVDVVPNVQKFTVVPGKEVLKHKDTDRAAQDSKLSGLELMVKSMEQDEESPHLTEADFEQTLKDKAFVFVDFYAPWCIWCKRLAPEWEAFARDIHNEHYDSIAVRKVDCDKHPRICSEQMIRGFPTMRLFKKGYHLAEYSGRRGHADLLKWAADITGESDREHHYRKLEIKGLNEEHIGCRMSGYVLAHRVPGNFHLQAKADTHSINVRDTNLSHTVHHLSFGEPLKEHVIAALPAVYRSQMHPLDGQTFVSEDTRFTFEHYIKVLTTTYDLQKKFTAYQFQHTNHQYLFEEQHAADDEGEVPEARFSFDFSSTAVVVQRGGRRWYEFITNLCAIIGGVYTVMSLLDRSLHTFKSHMFKDSVGKLG